jgi:SNF2 family DNA or RNA helicase
VDRAHRMGQKRVVTVYRLLSQGSLDEQVAKLAAGKLELDLALKGRGLLGGGLPGSSKKEKPRPAEEKKAVLEALVRVLM